MQQQDGLVCAYDLDGTGGGRPLSWEQLVEPAGGALRWVHLDRAAPRAQRRLAEDIRVVPTASLT